MLEQDKTQERIDRHHITQEDFTPECVLDKLCPSDSDPLYTDFTKTFCDPCAGIGNILIYVLTRRLQHCYTVSDISYALQTIYAVELMQDNVDEMKQRILDTCYERYKSLHIRSMISPLVIWKKIIDVNIVCSDFFKWDFDNWRPIQEYKSIELF